MVNAARELAAWELARPCHGAARRETPMFVDGSGRAISADTLRSRFKALLTAAGFVKAALSFVTLHSFRVYLACALLELGRSHDQIKALLRWRSDEALRVYARLNADSYAALLDGVGSAAIDQSRAHNLPQVDIDGRAQQLHGAQKSLEAAAARADAANLEAPESDDEDGAAEGEPPRVAARAAAAQVGEPPRVAAQAAAPVPPLQLDPGGARSARPRKPAKKKKPSKKQLKELSTRREQRAQRQLEMSNAHFSPPKEGGRGKRVRSAAAT